MTKTTAQRREEDQDSPTPDGLKGDIHAYDDIFDGSPHNSVRR
jgi:hypothetical protein